MGFFEDNYQHNSSNDHHIKWEYKEVTISTVNDNTSQLNELGEQGWEMCGYDARYGVAVFKRIKR